MLLHRGVEVRGGALSWGWKSGPLGLVPALLPTAHLAAVAQPGVSLDSDLSPVSNALKPPVTGRLVGWLVAGLSSALGLGGWK